MVGKIDFTRGFNDAWTHVATFVPKFIAFLLILVIGYFVAKTIASLLNKPWSASGSTAPSNVEAFVRRWPGPSTTRRTSLPRSCSGLSSCSCCSSPSGCSVRTPSAISSMD
jgi:mechanosensitive ion channel-like protein